MRYSTRWVPCCLGLLFSAFLPGRAAVSAATPTDGPEVSRPRARTLVIGHAGSGFFHPFNPLPPSSLRSIQRALRRGADGVEVDVRLSQDSIPVLYHDHTLDSMTDGQGCVSQAPAATLTGLRYRHGWPSNWLQHERLITFENLLAHLARRGAMPYLHLDLHEDDACVSGDTLRSRALVRQLRTLLARYSVPPERVLILTNRPSTLAYLHQLLPAVSLGLEVTGEIEGGLAQLAGLPEVGTVVLHKDDVTPARAAHIRALGRELVVFGGRSARAVARIMAVHPAAYEVDNVRQLQLALRRER